MKYLQNKSWLSIAAVVLLPCIAYPAFLWCENELTTLPIIEPQVKTANSKPHTVPPFSFTNQLEQEVSSTDWQGKIIVADFIFTHCPVVCPRMTGNLLKVQEAFTKDSSVQFVSFTVDPERDNSGQLKKYADRFGIHPGQWQLLTGSKPVIYRLARNGFLLTATDGDGGPNDFIHSEKVVLVDKQRRIRGFYTGIEITEIETLIQDIRKLQHEE